ncbi:hypothetical protein AB0M39_39715 [Streptomyces sp. NPDC051907]|uniref:hypothetical protein n=1 Tax=Streptomyces sp. NPDC051907 TaxID=3155284 RepID=UPI003419DCF9
MPPFTAHCTFDAGGDLTLALETSPHLPGRVIAVLRNDHKRFMHAVRILECDPAAALPAGDCGSLDSLPEQLPYRTLLEGIDRLLGDCAGLLTPGSAHADGLHEQPDPSQFTVRIAPGEKRCRVMSVLDADGRVAAQTFVSLPESWTDDEPRTVQLSAADAPVPEAAMGALHLSRVRTRRARANADAYRQAFGGFASRFADGGAGPVGQWVLSSDDCGIELSLSTPDPKDSWRLLRLLEEWLGHHVMEDVGVTLDEERRSVRALLRGTAPVHFVAWHQAQQ